MITEKIQAKIVCLSFLEKYDLLALRKWPYLLSSQRMHERRCSVCAAGYRFLPDCQPSAGRQGDDGLWLGAGGGESGLINTLVLLQDHPDEHQMNSELHIFSSSDIGYGILQKWHLSTQVVKFCLNKTSFHIQFYIMRTFQNWLAHVNYVADVETMDSDGKTHASLNICMHVCVYVFGIRDVPTSLSISSPFIFK